MFFLAMMRWTSLSLHPLPPRRVCLLATYNTVMTKIMIMMMFKRGRLQGTDFKVHVFCVSLILTHTLFLIDRTLRLWLFVSYLALLLAVLLNNNAFLPSTSIMSDTAGSLPSAVLVSCMVVQEQVGTALDQ